MCSTIKKLSKFCNGTLICPSFIIHAQKKAMGFNVLLDANQYVNKIENLLLDTFKFEKIF